MSTRTTDQLPLRGKQLREAWLLGKHYWPPWGAYETLACRSPRGGVRKNAWAAR